MPDSRDPESSAATEQPPVGATATAPHLTLFTSDRGLHYAPSTVSRDGGGIEVHTSSLAFEGPHIRMTASAPVDLNQPAGRWLAAYLHLSAADGLRFAAQIVAVVAAHYQLRPVAAGHPDLIAAIQRDLAELTRIVWEQA
jgi:hypothetical protein